MEPYANRRARRLAALAQRQKPEALDEYFTTITQQFRPYMQTLANSMLQNRDDAEDIVSEALYKAYIHLHGFTIEERKSLKAKAWLAEITRNLCIDHQMKAKTVSLERLLQDGYPLIAHPYSNPENRVFYADGIAILSKCIDEGLSPREKEVVRRFFIEGESRANVAKSLGISTTTLYVVFHRAIRKLRHPRYSRKLIVRVDKELLEFVLRNA